MQALAQKNGIELSVGDITADDIIPDTITEAEGPQPKEVAARLFAHLGHRIPGARKIEKRLEGKELKSGVASDLLALFAQLYARNKQQIDGAAEQLAAQKLQEVLNNKRGPEGVVPVVPIDPNNNGGI